MKQRELKFRMWMDGKMGPATWTLDAATLKRSLAINPAAPLIADLGTLILAMQAKGAVLMQYTGLKDRNGREIYHYDTVHGYDGLQFEVQWVEGDAAWNMGAHDAMNMEVIGNRFENPELAQD